jgi:hypothetical protein
MVSLCEKKTNFWVFVGFAFFSDEYFLEVNKSAIFVQH